jgi:hypothetical protein
MSKLWKLTHYGNRGKTQTCFSTVSTALGKLSMNIASFPQFPQPLQRHVQFVFLNQKPDISTLVKTGHFYFGWTRRLAGLLATNRNVRFCSK